MSINKEWDKVNYKEILDDLVQFSEEDFLKYINISSIMMQSRNNKEISKAKKR